MSDLDFPFSGEEENVGAHFLAVFGGGSYHHRGSVFEGTSVRVWVEEAGGGDVQSFGITNGRLEVDKQFLGVIG